MAKNAWDATAQNGSGFLKAAATTTADTTLCLTLFNNTTKNK